MLDRTLDEFVFVIDVISSAFSNYFYYSLLLHQGELHGENTMVIPEVVEIRATAEHLSRSFDDNSEFERAEECAEDTGES